MKTYEDIKKSLSENRQNIILAIGYVLVFFLGLGIGRYDLEWQKRSARLRNDYNTKITNTQKTEPAKTPQDTQPKVLSASSTQPCLIKGNISSQGKKIYHMPGGSFYGIVKPEACFFSETEAKSAGYVRSSR